jgi:hypothetical protein
MAIFQLLKAGVVDAVAAFPDGATISPDGTTLTWTGGAFVAPAGHTIMQQAGAVVGWMLSGSTLAPPAQTTTQLRDYANAKADALRAVARAYTLTGVVVYCDSTQGTGTDLLSLQAWGTANAAATTNFVQDNGGVVTLTGAQCVALAQDVLAYGQSLFATLASAMNQIANGTITTTDAIDALSWPS